MIWMMLNSKLALMESLTLASKMPLKSSSVLSRSKPNVIRFFMGKKDRVLSFGDSENFSLGNYQSTSALTQTLSN